MNAQELNYYDFAEDDINICWESVKACKKTVDDYIASKKPEKQNGQIQTGA